MQQPALLQVSESTKISDIVRTLNLLVAGVRSAEYFEPLASPPPEPGEGMLAFADGSSWNPGSGAGLYQYVGGSWVSCKMVSQPIGSRVYGERVIPTGSGTQQIFGERVV